MGRPGTSAGRFAAFPRPRRRARVLAVLLMAGCGWTGERSVEAPGPAARTIPAEPIPATAFAPEIDVDSLARAFSARADTLPVVLLPVLELEIRNWLGRLEYGDPALLPMDRDPGGFFRHYRGRLLDALGWSAFRRGDLRQAEAALVSAVDGIHNRGVTSGFARHFLHLGRVYAARGRWGPATEALLAAEQRGAGGEATPELEAAHRRWRGSLRGLDALRARERARIEDERRQMLVAGATATPLPRFSWPRRTGPPMASSELAGRPTVVAVWGEGCAACEGWSAALEPLARDLAARGGALVGVWLGADPARAGPPRSFPVLVPEDPAAAALALGARRLPALLVVDYAGRIRYRHGGPEAAPPPVEDVLIQIDHLERRRG
ncbi:MAG TPA: hypothetical protein VM778_06590 [Gemmatimonadota bacterium]|nr:hypothetical protein [Gemmatimonadota bacterium]